MKSEHKPSDPIKKLSEQLDVEFTLQTTGLGVWEFDTKDGVVAWDDRCRELFGLAKDNYLSYEQAMQYIHPEDVERVQQAVQRAIDPESDGQYDETYRTIGADGKLRWVRFYGRAYFSENGEIRRFGGVAHEITERKLAEEREAAAHQLHERQQRILAAISSSTPDLMYVFDLNYRFTYANQALLDMWGSDWENSIGKSLLENGYEPWHAEMHEREIDQVVATRKLIRGQVSFPHATLGRRIYDYVFAPVINELGEVEAVAGTTRDITQLIIARQALEEKEAALSNAIEVAELGTWRVNVVTRTCTLSARVADWFGFDNPNVDLDSFLECIDPDDRQQVHHHLYHIQTPDVNRFDQIFTIVNAGTGQKRVIHAVGRVYINEQELPVRIEGSAQDITVQQELTLFLEQQVRQRTEELATINEKLATSNEELEQANQLLTSSNDNLQNFAYVASHDLQEPLRKIQQFGQLLIDRQTTLSQSELLYVGRMQSAAARMAVLIQDLLDFSSLSNRQEINELVPLNDVIDNVLTTLELAIAEAQATISVDPLPKIQGDASQLSQLFQNLIGNAIKFKQQSVPPAIHISSQILEANQLPQNVKPSRPATFYYQINVVDNGIGFDEKYLDRIFQVFQRLHGKNEFSGTGIGLAICQRVATNHGGAITASSSPDSGSVFTVFLPV